MGRLKALMAQPECNDGDIDPGLEQVHGGGVADHRGETVLVRRLGQAVVATWTTCWRRYMTPCRVKGFPWALGKAI